MWHPCGLKWIDALLGGRLVTLDQDLIRALPSCALHGGPELAPAQLRVTRKILLDNAK